VSSAGHLSDGWSPLWGSVFGPARANHPSLHTRNYSKATLRGRSSFGGRAAEKLNTPEEIRMASEIPAGGD
jgi:hypothetical protein